MLGKYLLWIGFGVFVLWLANATDLVGIIILFLIAGVIPGTSIMLPPLAMLVIMSIALLLVARWLKRQQLAEQIRQMKVTHHATAKKAATKSVRKKKTSASSARKRLATART